MSLRKPVLPPALKSVIAAVVINCGKSLSDLSRVGCLFSVGQHLSMRRCDHERMKRKTFFPWFKDEGEVIASFGQAQLVRFLDGKCVLNGGSKDDRIAAKEWISLFWHEVVVREV